MMYSSLTHSLTHVKHGATRTTAQCARKHYVHAAPWLFSRSGSCVRRTARLPAVLPSSAPVSAATFRYDSGLERDDRCFSQLGDMDTVAEPFSFLGLGLANDGLRPLAHWMVVSGIGESDERGVIRVWFVTCVTRGNAESSVRFSTTCS